MHFLVSGRARVIKRLEVSPLQQSMLVQREQTDGRPVKGAPASATPRDSSNVQSAIDRLATPRSLFAQEPHVPCSPGSPPRTALAERGKLQGHVTRPPATARAQLQRPAGGRGGGSGQGGRQKAAGSLAPRTLSLEQPPWAATPRSSARAADAEGGGGPLELEISQLAPCQV